ncbi:MAG: CvpA family protein [Prevotellaceae bacterium]|jgi:membrane protein required for colicin V production|nr:CvpA family protein [Prevotellaceae bacterium]
MILLDIIILLILVAAFIFGVMKGIIRQVFGLLALFLGVYCSFKFSYWAGGYIVQWFHTSEALTQGIAFALTFAVVVVAVILVGKLVARLISLAALGLFDKILGGLFGLLKFACILCVLLYIVQHFDAQFHFLSAEIKQSFFFQFFDTITKMAFPYLL